MKNNTFSIKHHLLLRLIVTFLCILLPIIFLGLKIYEWGINSIRSEITRTTISQVQFYLDSMDTELKRMTVLIFDCLYDKDLTEFVLRESVMDDYDKSITLVRIQQRISIIKNSSDYIDNVNVYIPSLNRVITTNPNTTKKFSRQEYESLIYFDPLSASHLLYHDDKISICAMHPLDLYSNIKPSYLVEIEISKKSLKNSFKQFLNYKDSGFFIVKLQDGASILNPLSDSEKQVYDSVKNQLSKFHDGACTVSINENSFLTSYVASKYSGLVAVKYVPEYEVYKLLENYRFWVWAILLLSLVIVVIYSVLTYMFIHKPLKSLVFAFQQVENGNLDIRIKLYQKTEFGYIYKKFNEMVEKLNVLIDQVYKQKILVQHAELKHLQSQINPHFLYNSFFILRTMMRKGEYESAEALMQQVGDYFKFITRNGMDEIPLKNEVQHARIYTQIQVTRFSTRLHVEFPELPADYEQVIVPRLILQPVIENAFEHGLKEKLNDGLLNVFYVVNGNSLDIVVEDNGETLSDEAIDKLSCSLRDNYHIDEITGLINVHRRLRTKFGCGYGLGVERSALGGLKITIKISGGEKNVQAFNY